MMAVVAPLVHGLIHVMGLVAYTGFGSVPDLPYKTTVLGGWIDLGSFGTALFGVAGSVRRISRPGVQRDHPGRVVNRTGAARAIMTARWSWAYPRHRRARV
jgi:hypothetical protein